jgi:hypothetical protein
MSKTNTTFWSTRHLDIQDDVLRLARHLTSTLEELSASESEAFHAEAFDHLIALRDLEEKFEKIYLARHEHERLTELSQREVLTLPVIPDDGGEDVDTKFSAPQGFDSPTHRGSTVYCNDLHSLVMRDGKIEAARVTNFTGGLSRDLTADELIVCNTLMQRM